MLTELPGGRVHFLCNRTKLYELIQQNARVVFIHIFKEIYNTNWKSLKYVIQKIALHGSGPL